METIITTGAVTPSNPCVLRPWSGPTPGFGVDLMVLTAQQPAEGHLVGVRVHGAEKSYRFGGAPAADPWLEPLV